MTDHLHQQPGNGLSIKRIDTGDGLPRHLAAVFEFPRGTGKVLSDHFVFSIMQLRVGSLERPTELAIDRGLAGIDLRTSRMREQHNFFAGGRLNRIRNVRAILFYRSVFGLRARERGSKDKDEGDQPDDRCSRLKESSHEGDCSRRESSEKRSTFRKIPIPLPSLAT